MDQYITNRNNSLSLIGRRVVAVLLLLAATVAYAETFTTEGQYTEVYSSGYYDSDGLGGDSGAYLERVAINGLQKFDPSLGDLEDVTLAVGFDYEFVLVLYSGDVDDPEQEFEATVSLPYLNFFIGYNPTDSLSTYSLAAVDPAPDVSLYGFPYDSYIQEEYSDYITGESQEESIFFSSGYVESDFIGYGDVDTLEAIIAVPAGADFTLLNLSFADAEVEAYLYSAPVTLTYTYSQPLPGDANRDGTVNLDDFIILKQNYGYEDASWSEGDFNGDATVNLDDFIILKQNYGTSS